MGVVVLAVLMQPQLTVNGELLLDTLSSYDLGAENYKIIHAHNPAFIILLTVHCVGFYTHDIVRLAIIRHVMELELILTQKLIVQLRIWVERTLSVLWLVPAKTLSCWRKVSSLAMLLTPVPTWMSLL